MSKLDVGLCRPLQAVIFDWAGTLVDFGSLAPMGAFVSLFEAHGIELTVPEARIPMGLPKWQHIQALGRLPRVAQAWQATHGRSFCDADVNQLHDEFTPMSARAAAQHAQCIPGVLDVVDGLRQKGLKIGSTTGYTRAIMEQVVPVARAQGLVVDNLVCADDLKEGRPGPLGIYKCLLDLQVWPASAVVKVDDTVPGLMEGRHAGCWTVGVAATGNAAGLSLSEWSALSNAHKQQVLQRAHLTLEEARPDFIVDSVMNLPEVIHHIENLRDKGIAPGAIVSPVA